MLILTGQLTWDDLGPARRAVDEARVRALVADLLEGGTRLDAARRRALADQVDVALLAELGPWVAGWNWSASEPGQGGPVRPDAWCCADDSFLKGKDPIGATVDRIVEAIRDWQAFLEELDRAFAELAPEVESGSVEVGVELAARRLLPLVLDRTQAEDAWYATFVIVLTWFLESIGHEAGEVGPAIEGVVKGHFRSWSVPAPTTVEVAVEELGREVARTASTPPSAPDALARWLEHRPELPRAERQVVARRPVSRDAHRHFIRTIDAGRGEARASGLIEALAACRGAARDGARLGLEVVREWQGLVLGVGQAPIRSGPAFAKGGRERYGWDAGALARFEACLDEANDEKLDPTVRAARVYLDVCFFHPFEDGNARAARLVLDFVLSRAGLALHACEPLFVMSRSVVDGRDVFLLWLALDRLTGLAEVG